MHIRENILYHVSLIWLDLGWCRKMHRQTTFDSQCQRFRGKTESQIWKFLILLIACSKWIRSRAISCMVTTSSGGINLQLLPRDGGIIKETPKGKMSLVVKHLSAPTESPSLNCKSSMPDLSTISISEARFRRRSTRAKPNSGFKYGKRAASQSVWYGSFNLVQQKR